MSTQTQTDQLLSGLRVIELAAVLAGPAVGMFFAELGAKVIKIENKTTGGDMTRAWKLPVEDQNSPTSAYFFSVNWGKEHLFLDLNSADAQAQVHALVREADVVISNFKPSSALRLRMDADTLRAVNPTLIFAQINAFSDPEDERPAFDIVLQAEAGFLYMTGEAGRGPVRMPVAFIDLLAAHQLKEAILLALLRRAGSGQGCFVQTSLFESAVASLANQASNYLNTGYIPQRIGTQHPNIAPYGDIFTTADGEYLLLAVGTERQYRQLCTAVLGAGQLAEHPDFLNNAGRVQHRAALCRELATLIAPRTLDDLLASCRQHGVPAAQIRDMAAVCSDAAVQAMILETPEPDGSYSKRLQSVAFTLKD